VWAWIFGGIARAQRCVMAVFLLMIAAFAYVDVVIVVLECVVLIG
jgi:hypothetical protein